MNKVICTKAFTCEFAETCGHARPHEGTPRCTLTDCPDAPGARCAAPLFYLTEIDLRDSIEDLGPPNLDNLTDEEFQSVAEDAYIELQRTWENDVRDVIDVALEYIMVAREEE